jgi:hypothetical protein
MAISFCNPWPLLDFDNNSGIFTALIYGLKVGVKEDVDPYKILDEVFYEIEENKKEGFEYIKIADFFESIKIYQITKNCPFVYDNLEFTEKDIEALEGHGAYRTSDAIEFQVDSYTKKRLEELGGFEAKVSDDPYDLVSRKK